MDDLAVLVGKRFIERRDVKAVQLDDGSYRPDHSPFTVGDLRAHLGGDRTLGHYLVGTNDVCRLFAFDIDLTKDGRAWQDDDGIEVSIEPRECWLDPASRHRQQLTIQLRCLAETLALRIKSVLEIPTAIAYSGAKGLHVYGFLDGGEPAAEARGLALAVLESLDTYVPTRGNQFWQSTSNPNVEVEVYPKQDSLDGKKLGNLMRLPLGINLKTRQAGFFVDVCCGYDQLRPADPVRALESGDPWADDKCR